MIFNSQDYCQSRCVVLGKTQEASEDNFCFLKLGEPPESVMYAERPDARWVILEGTLRVSDLCIRTGLLSSRKEFYRKWRAGAIRYNGRALVEDLWISMDEPQCLNEIRMGRKLLEWVVPSCTPSA